MDRVRVSTRFQKENEGLNGSLCQEDTNIGSSIKARPIWGTLFIAEIVPRRAKMLMVLAVTVGIPVTISMTIVGWIDHK